MGEKQADVIPPSVGRMVHFFAGEGEHNVTGIRGVPLAATIAAVHNDRLVNLTVHHYEGGVTSLPNVRLVQPCDIEDPEVQEWVQKRNHAAWMPYQAGQAAQAQAPGAPQQEIATLRKELANALQDQEELRQELSTLRDMISSPQYDPTAKEGAGAQVVPGSEDTNGENVPSPDPDPDPDPDPAEGSGGSAPGQEEPDNKE